MTYREGTVERFLHRLHIISFRCQLCMTGFHTYSSETPNPSQGMDRREYTRLSSSFQAHLLDNNATRVDGRVTEISMGGCTFETSNRLPNGSFLELMIKPASYEDIIKVEAATVCSVRNESLGIRFLDLRPNDKQRLSQVILNLLVGQGIRPNLQY